MTKSIGIYCSASDMIDAVYVEMAKEMGRLLAERDHRLVYGGGKVGLMGAIARSVHDHGGTVFGVIPEALKAREGVAYDVADRLVITQTMQERKALIYTEADAFIVLPGGFGTLEEFMEVLTLKQLHYHHKPIVLVNVNGFFEPLLTLFDHLYRERFARELCRSLYYVAPSPAEALDYVAQYRGGPIEDKWT